MLSPNLSSIRGQTHTFCKKTEANLLNFQQYLTKYQGFVSDINLPTEAKYNGTV